MKVKTEVKFREAYIPPRCRKERYRNAVKTIYTTIPEASYADAPVALRRQACLLEDAANEAGIYPNGITAIVRDVDGLAESEMWVDYRWYKNHLYCRVLAYDKFCGGKGPWNVESLTRRYATYKHWHASGDFAAASKAVRSELHNYLLLDGDVWAKAGEPVYEIATFGLGHNHASTALMNSTYYKDSYRRECFNALQREAAITECKRVAIARGDTDSVARIGEFWKIEVLIPEAVKAPQRTVSSPDEFGAQAEEIIRQSKSAFEAGLLVMSAALAKGK